MRSEECLVIFLDFYAPENPKCFCKAKVWTQHKQLCVTHRGPSSDYSQTRRVEEEDRSLGSGEPGPVL